MLGRKTSSTGKYYPRIPINHTFLATILLLGEDSLGRSVNFSVAGEMTQDGDTVVILKDVGLVLANYSKASEWWFLQNKSHQMFPRYSMTILSTNQATNKLKSNICNLFIMLCKAIKFSNANVYPKGIECFCKQNSKRE